MDSVAAMLAEAIARRLKEAQARSSATLEARAAAGDPSAQQLLARVRGAGLQAAAPAQPAPVANPAPAYVAAAPYAPAAAGIVRAPRPDPAPSLPGDDDSFGTLPSLPLAIFEGDAIDRPQLLNAFSGTGLLSGIVLAEALAKPLSLRENGAGGAF